MFDLANRCARSHASGWISDLAATRFMHPAIGRPVALIVFLLVGAGACAGHGSPNARPVDQNFITSEQIVDQHFLTAFDAVQALHPLWLQVRGPNSLRNPSQVRVYLDAQLLGGVESLRSINASIIRSIEFVDGLQASARWGLDHGGGVILVMTQA